MRVGPAQLWPEVAPQWILGLPQWMEDFCYDIYKSFIFDDRYEMYVRGLGNTLLLTAMATLMGILLGVVIALLRATWDKNSYAMHGPAKVALRIVNTFCNIYLTVIRGTPVLVQLMIWYFVVFASSRNGLMILETEYVLENYAAAMNKDNTALYEAVNAALEELIADGTVKSIIEKYIPAE